MEKISNEPTKYPVCAAAELAKYVDSKLNGAAMQEFTEATSELQDFGADLGEGSAYLDDSPVSFAEQTVDCGQCHGVAKLSPEGSVESTKCPSSGFCELEWIESYPEKYMQNNGDLTANRLTCAETEMGCRAVITIVKVDGTPRPSLSRGICEVARHGNDWQERYHVALQNVTCRRPEEGIEKFDGAGSGREEGSLY